MEIRAELCQDLYYCSPLPATLNSWAVFLAAKNYYMLDLHNVANEVNNFTPFRKGEKKIKGKLFYSPLPRPLMGFEVLEKNLPSHLCYSKD